MAGGRLIKGGGLIESCFWPGRGPSEPKTQFHIAQISFLSQAHAKGHGKQILSKQPPTTPEATFSKFSIAIWTVDLLSTAYYKIGFFSAKRVTSPNCIINSIVALLINTIN